MKRKAQTWDLNAELSEIENLNVEKIEAWKKIFLKSYENPALNFQSLMQLYQISIKKLKEWRSLVDQRHKKSLSGDPLLIHFSLKAFSVDGHFMHFFWTTLGSFHKGLEMLPEEENKLQIWAGQPLSSFGTPAILCFIFWKVLTLTWKMAQRLVKD